MKIDFLKHKREELIKELRRWGSSTSDAVCDENCQHFSISEIPGFIPYRLEAKCAIVFGDPVCSIVHMPKLVKYFHEHCRKNKHNIVYLIASKQFASFAINNVCSSLLEFGEELFLNPLHDDPKKGAEGALLRKKIRRAIKENVEVKEYFFDKVCDKVLEENIQKAINSWLNGRKGPQVYISHTRLFQDRFGRRWFYAEKEKEIIGIALLNKLEERNGFVLTQIFLSPSAPVGTSELLANSIIETLAKEKVTFLSFGAVPAKEIGDIQGLNKFSSFLIRLFFKISKKLFRFDGKKVFWQKFQPKAEPSYVLFSNSSIKISDIVGLIKAVNMSL